MAEAATQWTMTAPAAPFVRRDFAPFPPSAGEVVVAIVILSFSCQPSCV